MKVATIACSLLLLVVSCRSQFSGFMAFCFTREGCRGKHVPRLLTVRECCLGLERVQTFSLPGVESCISCIVYGWSQPQYVGSSREEFHCVDIAAQKGGSQLQESYVTYDVVLRNDGNATEGNDFIYRKQTVSLEDVIKGPISVCFQLLLNGVIGEPNKTFSLEIRLVDGTQPSAFFFNQLQVVIVDGDAPNVDLTLTEVDVTVREDEHVTICVVPDHTNFSRSIPIQIWYQSGSALENRDYTISATEITVLPDQPVSGCFNITIINDDTFELEETFTITISSTDRNVSFIEDNVEVTIVDEDMLSIGWRNTSIKVREGDGDIKICTAILQGTVGAVLPPLIVTTSEGSAQKELDYMDALPQLIQFEPDGATTLCTTVKIVDDSEIESFTPEDFVVELILPNLQRITAPYNVSLITIKDNEVVTVGFTKRMVTVREGESDVAVCIAKSKTVDKVTVILQVETVPAVSFNITLEPEDEVTCITSLLENIVAVQDVGSLFLLRIIDVMTVPEDRGRISIDVEKIEVIVESPPAEVTVNDTVSGDPLMTVPILVPPEQLQLIQLDQLSLCYEVHGQEDTWFNLVSDKCTSINAHYHAVTDHLNVIDKIAIRAIDRNGICRNIIVDAEDNCQVTVNGTRPKAFANGGVTIRRFKNRVRVSVPNCNTVKLTIWVECSRRDDVGFGLSGSGSGSLGGDDLLVNESAKLVVMRGLNYGSRLAHGLLGQYWNVPVSIERHVPDSTTLYGMAHDLFVVNITRSNRSYVGVLGHVTWEHEEKACLYVGDSQSDSIAEVELPNDSVIEGDYLDYVVSEAFEDDFTFGKFDSAKC